jgi:hypothetical protein
MLGDAVMLPGGTGNPRVLLDRPVRYLHPINDAVNIAVLDISLAAREVTL